MNKKFGGGKPPTGTLSLAWSCVVVVVSLLAGVYVVHNIYKPDLLLFPPPSADSLFDKMREIKYIASSGRH
ncbi:Protein BRAWNIN [Dillenia turbinata]|uniref:Protein BRAWNIN n=1 Tax=Dillenia turbinata TaxID=194707 RepID=A0AAN8ZG03_9MAGN